GARRLHRRQHGAGALRGTAGAPDVGALPQARLRDRHRRAGPQDAARSGVRKHDVAPIRRLLVANRGEIAIRVVRAARELGQRTVAVFSPEDRGARHRFVADESYLIGAERTPINAYLDVDAIVRVALRARVDAIHPGYGFLAESPDFAAACVRAGLVFVGPAPETMRALGNKISARALAQALGVPTLPGSGALPRDPAEARVIAQAIGYPLMLKASRGGGGRGLRVVAAPSEL